MKKFTVIALSCAGLSNRIYNSGDVVSENCFEPGHAEILVEKGFLKPAEATAELTDETVGDEGSEEGTKSSRKKK